MQKLNLTLLVHQYLGSINKKILSCLIAASFGHGVGGLSESVKKRKIHGKVLFFSENVE